MYIKQIYISCLAEASYYVDSNNEAIIIDPIRDTEPYINLLRERKATLKYIFETHFHADFVSGHLELSRLTGAKIIFGPNANTSYDIITATDRQEFPFGFLKIRALHTPGHTLESTCYLLISKENNEEAVFTGDTLFIGDVGRPDLAVNKIMNSSDLAGMLYDSLRNTLMQLPNHVIVYPAHGAGSACGKNISSEKQSTIGLQKEFNYALQPISKKEFIQVVLDGMPSAPKYFEHDVMLNREGYKSASKIIAKSLKKLIPSEIEDEIAKGTVVLDVRMPKHFESGFIPTSINIGKAGMFAPWVGTIMSPNSNMIIICNPNEEREVISRLARVGYEKIIGFMCGVDEWKKDKRSLDNIASILPKEILSHIKNSIKILDVRGQDELKSGVVKNSIHIPVQELENSLNEIEISENYLVYCGSGYRSMIACSILKSNGFNNIKNIYGGFNAISQNIDISSLII